MWSNTVFRVRYNTSHVLLKPSSSIIHLFLYSSKALSATLETFENTTITGHFGFVFEKIRSEKSHDYRDFIIFGKLTRKASVFKFHWFEERFRKVPFSFRINVDSKPNRRNKVAF